MVFQISHVLHGGFVVVLPPVDVPDSVFTVAMSTDDPAIALVDNNNAIVVSAVISVFFIIASILKIN